METSTTLFSLLFLGFALFVPAVIFSGSFMRWFRLQKYRYEVTFALYMLTPTEKFILNSIVFLMFSMIIIAASLYLPEHIITISNRAFYYWSGYTQIPSPAASATRVSASAVSSAISEMIVNASQGIAEKGQQLAAEVANAASNAKGAGSGHQSVDAFQTPVAAQMAGL